MLNYFIIASAIYIQIYSSSVIRVSLTENLMIVGAIDKTGGKIFSSFMDAGMFYYC